MPTRLTLDDHLTALRHSGKALGEAAAAAGLEAKVPTCPSWTVSALVSHQGMVHRWAAANLRRERDHDADASLAAAAETPDLLEWYSAGLDALLETIAATADDAEAFVFLNDAPPPRRFWARRQAHETAIHRADAEAAAPAGDVTPFDAPFAQDGIAELLNGFARRRSNAIARPGTVGLDAADGPSWLITLGGERIEAAPSEDLVETDVVVRGLSSDLYLWLWNRPTEAAVDGDEAVAAAWSSVRVHWS